MKTVYVFLLALVGVFVGSSLLYASDCYLPGYRSYGYRAPYYAPSYAPSPVIYSAPAYQYYGASIASNGTYYPSGYYAWNGANWVHEQLGAIPLGNPPPISQVVVTQPAQPFIQQPSPTVVIQQPSAPVAPQAPSVYVQPAPQGPVTGQPQQPQLTNEDVQTLQKMRALLAQLQQQPAPAPAQK